MGREKIMGSGINYDLDVKMGEKHGYLHSEVVMLEFIFYRIVL